MPATDCSAFSESRLTRQTSYKGADWRKLAHTGTPPEPPEKIARAASMVMWEMVLNCPKKKHRDILLRTARFGCLRRFCLSTHSESFGVIRWPECDCVCAGVGLSGGRGRLLTHVHRASACTLNAVGLLPVSGRGDARVAPPCPTTLCVWRNLPYLTLPSLRQDYQVCVRTAQSGRFRRGRAQGSRKSRRRPL